MLGARRSRASAVACRDVAGDAPRHASGCRRVPAAQISDGLGGLNERTFETVAAQEFSKIARVLDIPNLIEIQKRSFERFLQADVEPEKRENAGLQAVFSSVFPISDFNETASLEFVGYTLEEPKYDVQECLQRGMTYAAPFKVTLRLVVWDDPRGTRAAPRRPQTSAT